MSARRATLTLASLHRPHDAMGIFAGWAWPLCSCATAAGDPRTENRRPGIVPGCLASLEDTAQASHRGVFSAAVTSLVSQRRHAAPIYGAACAVACGACTSARAARHLQPSLKALSSFIHYKERIVRLCCRYASYRPEGRRSNAPACQLFWLLLLLMQQDETVPSLVRATRDNSEGKAAHWRLHCQFSVDRREFARLWSRRVGRGPFGP